MAGNTGACTKCDAPATMQCGKCRVARYCNQQCQSDHWKVHKKVCKAPGIVAPQPSSVASTRRERVTPLCGQGYRQWLQEHGAPNNGPQHIEPPAVGLQNQENTCYLNAVLQCLVHSPMLRTGFCQAISDDMLLQQRRPEEEWLVELLRFFREVDEARGTRRTVSASSVAALVTTNKEFARGQQADAHEALMLIISKLLAGCASVGDGSGRCLSNSEYAAREDLESSSLVGHVFGMDLGQTVRCERCSYASQTARVEYCLCLSCTLGLNDVQRAALQRDALNLQMGQYPYATAGYHSSQETSAPATTLEDLLTEHTRQEFIEGFKCERCERSTGCQRTAYVARRPNVLIVYIDRRQDSNMYGKINRRVWFDEQLDLAPFMGAAAEQNKGPCDYSLYAVVVHKDVNRSTFFGHYITYVRDCYNQWHLLDDYQVHPVSWATVQEQHAYLLFYSADVMLPPPVTGKMQSIRPAASASSSTASTCSSAGASTRETDSLPDREVNERDDSNTTSRSTPAADRQEESQDTLAQLEAEDRAVAHPAVASAHVIQATPTLPPGQAAATALEASEAPAPAGPAPGRGPAATALEAALPPVVPPAPSPAQMSVEVPPRVLDQASSTATQASTIGAGDTVCQQTNQAFFDWDGLDEEEERRGSHT